MQNNDVVKVYSSPDPVMVNIAKALFQEHDVEFFELNKRDSTYIMLGEDELYVNVKDEHFARLLLEQNQL